MLLLGRDGADPLFLQFKEAEASVLEPFLGKSEFANHGQRVVEGQRLTQAASDIMLGWIRLDGLDGVKRDFYVRQLWDDKGSALIDQMNPPDAGRLRSRLRVRACTRARPLRRSRSRSPATSAAATPSTGALTQFAEAYADQNERDYQTLTKAVRDGVITAETGV